ncbi:GALNT10 (predicted) [Pycnogonum litorale]
MRRSTKRFLKYSVIILTALYVGFIVLKFSSSFPKIINVKSVPVDYDMAQISTDEPDGKIDWHNHQQIREEKERKGPGEQGVAYVIPNPNKDEVDGLYKVNGFNAAVSRRIALNRSVPDIRHKGCWNVTYLKRLPTVSIVVPFHNEDNSTLLRTAYSVINRSPEHLIHEVILVDDFSTKVELKQQLDEYLKKYLPKVRVIRAPKREGLIRARLLGAKAATGKVLIFLDSHTEATVNWLPPLIEPIAKDMKTVVCPFIDVIDYETFLYRAQDEGARGAFDWELYYKRLPLLPDDLANPTRPFKSPVMAGGLFAINRKWFWMLGGYDEGLDIWGGEQYELSFKIWQCGGQMVDAPCSRIGHIYRKFAPFPNPGIGDFLSRNYKRLIVAWMDEYGEYIYKRKPNIRNIDPGDLSKPRKIRKDLNCKPFKWFMENVAFDLILKYPPIEPPDYASGEIRTASGDLCIDTKFKGQNDRFGLEKCIKDNVGASGEQKFQLSWHKDIRPQGRSVCFDVSTSYDRSPILLYTCHGSQGNQLWRYNPETRQLYHRVSNSCLDCDVARKELYMSQCNSLSTSQKWQIEKVNATALQFWDKSTV